MKTHPRERFLRKEGERHGKGILTSVEGDILYEGGYKEGKPHGKGIISNTDGAKYEGYLKNGKKHGHGNLTYPDGTKYLGGFKEDMMHGQGEIILPDGKKYAGEWQDDRYPDPAINKIIEAQLYGDYAIRGFGYVSESTNQFIFPAVDIGKRQREGDLILGSTTMKQAVKMLPSWPGHKPQRKKLNKPGKLGKVLRDVYTYIPMISVNHLSLAFNKNKKLVVVQANFLGEKERNRKQQNIKALIEQYQLKEESRNVKEITLQGEITDCVSVNVYKPLEDEKQFRTIICSSSDLT